jgi:predicted acetyltransferase
MEAFLLSFVHPQKKFAASYAEALREGLELNPVPLERILRIESDFEGWLKEQTDLTVPVTLPDGKQIPRVPQTTMWLVEDDRFIGRVGVRHSLNEELQTYGGHIGYAVRQLERGKGYGTMMLTEGMRVAKEFGLDKVLLTCNDDNIGSIKIIEGAGGVMAEKVSVLNRSVPHRLYWIDLDKAKHKLDLHCPNPPS